MPDNVPPSPATAPSPPPPRLNIDSRVVHQLGEELITDTGQALLELAKNAYDADSSDCQIRVDTKSHWFTVDGVIFAQDDLALQTLTPEQKRRAQPYQGHITVTDSGEGMSPDTIRNSWLVISLSAKREFKAQGNITKLYHRTPLGDKGLGRLGTMKLGAVLRIETQIETAVTGTDVSFSWEDCISGRTLGDVPVIMKDAPKTKPKGTKLTVIGLKDLAYWQSSLERTRLERQLSTLISPFATFENFRVDIQVDGLVIAHQDAKEYLELALAKFELTWDNVGSIFETKGWIKLDQFQVKRHDEFFERHVVADGGARLFDFLCGHRDTKDLRLTKSTDKWFLSFTTEQKQSDLGQLLKSSDHEDPGPITGTVYSFNIDPHRRASAGADLPKVPDFMKEHWGIFVFRDNFRIRMGEDWLQLGENATTGASYYGLRPRNTLGWIALSARDNKKLVEKSDREGFVDNKAKRGFDFLALQFRNTINADLEALRRTYLRYREMIEKEQAGKTVDYDLEQAEQDLQQAKTAATEIASKLNDLAGGLKQSRALAAEVEESVTSNGSVKQEARSAARKLRELIDSLEPLFSQITVIAKELSTVEIAVKTVKNEVETVATQIEGLHHFAAIGVSANALIHELPSRISETVYGVDSAITLFRKMEIKNSRLYEILERVKVNAVQIGDRLRFMDPMLRSQKNRKEEVDLAKLVTEIKGFFKTELESEKIDFNIVVDEPFSVRINRGRLTQVFDNLIRNSLYWVQYYGKQVPGAKLEITAVVDSPRIVFSDNGYGIDPRLEGRLFDIFVSGKQGESGQGLGLFIAWELMAADGCSIRLMPERNEHKRRYQFELNFEALVRR